MTTTQEVVAAGAVAGATASIIAICSVAIYVLFIIAWWKIFTKAGVAGWKSLIPIYNQYTLFRISGMSGWWVILPIVVSFLLVLGGGATTQANGAATTTPSGPATVFATIGLIGLIIGIVVQIVQTVKLAGAFGKGTLFKVMSVFFPNITSLILAFGAAKYNKKFMHD